MLQFFLAILLVRLLENNLMLQTGVFHPANQVMFRSDSQGCHPAGHTLLWAVWRGDSGRFGVRRIHLSRAGFCWTHRPALHPVSASLVLHGKSQSHSPTEVRRRYIEYVHKFPHHHYPPCATIPSPFFAPQNGTCLNAWADAEWDGPRPEDRQTHSQTATGSES